MDNTKYRSIVKLDFQYAHRLDKLNIKKIEFRSSSLNCASKEF